MAKKAAFNIFENQRFSEFRKVLEERGFILHVLWEASDGIYIFAVIGKRPSYGGGDPLPGTEALTPKHRTIVVRDYGENNGFGVWLESNTGSYADGAEEIITGIAKETT